MIQIARNNLNSNRACGRRSTPPCSARAATASARRSGSRLVQMLHCGVPHQPVAQPLSFQARLDGRPRVANPLILLQVLQHSFRCPPMAGLIPMAVVRETHRREPTLDSAALTEQIVVQVDHGNPPYVRHFPEKIDWHSAPPPPLIGAEIEPTFSGVESDSVARIAREKPSRSARFLN